MASPIKAHLHAAPSDAAGRDQKTTVELNKLTGQLHVVVWAANGVVLDAYDCFSVIDLRDTGGNIVVRTITPRLHVQARGLAAIFGGEPKTATRTHIWTFAPSSVSDVVRIEIQHVRWFGVEIWNRLLQRFDEEARRLGHELLRLPA